MADRHAFPWGKVVLPMVILIGVFFTIASVYSKTGTTSSRADILMIDIPKLSGGEKMPGVPFHHDRHTQNIQEEKRCSTCHLERDRRLVFKFMRFEEGSVEEDMALYHDNCIACHTKIKAAGSPAGPIAGDCRSCHKEMAISKSARQSMSFDKSLHYRHDASATIAPKVPGEADNCSACHHIFDKPLNKIVYAKGQEGSCRYCHKEEKTESGSSMRMAAHTGCVNCHYDLSMNQKTTGPIECQGCHSSEAQKAIKAVATVPRMKRNQPDVTLLAGWMTDTAADAESVANQMNPVPFKHMVHEAANETCRACHHQSLKKCSECHTETGVPDGGRIQLAEAMHSKSSSRSCMGCHSVAQKDANCAGCHATMPERSFVENDCSLCHSIDRSSLGPWPMSPAAKRDLATAAFKSKAAADVKISDEQIPETVVINILEDKYYEAVFPHRQVFKSLASRVADSGMADHFHDRPETLCMGCHHNSPASIKPPKCASCHGATFKQALDGRPGLMGAYHGQCIQCHQVMGIKEPAATDCNKCHKPKANS